MKANFVELHETAKLEEILQISCKRPVVLFKHSNTCSISADVFAEISSVDSTVWLVVVQDARDISNEIAEKTGIRHESPQAIVIKDGKPIYHASHYDITSQDVENILSKESASL